MNVLPATPGPGTPPRRYRLPFLSSHPETPTATTFRFSTEGSDFHYRSNQAIRLILSPREMPGRLAHTFSLSSSPTESDHIAVTVRMTGSPYKEALRALKPGDYVEAIGPVGDLIYDPSRPAVMVAGGIGVAPFRGMLRYAADNGAPSPVVLLYSARSPGEFAFRGEFERIVREHQEIEVRYTVTRPGPSDPPWGGRMGRVDEPSIRGALRGLDRPKVYVVGLPRMVEDVLDLLRGRLSFLEDDLEYEYFLGYERPR